MSKTIRESLGPVHEQNAATIIDEATPQFEVKYSSSKRGPIKVTKFMTQDEAQAFLKKIRGEGMNGIVSKGGKPVRTPMKEDAKSERLAKIERAAKAREKDQAKQKEAAKQKHYAASAKSRESVKHFGNKDQFGRPKNEEVEQVDEISVKKKAQAYRKMRDRQADVSYNPHTGKSDMLADTPEKKRANRMLKRIGDKHGKDVKRAVYKSQYEEVEQVDEAKLDPMKKKPTARQLRAYRKEYKRINKGDDPQGLLKNPDGETEDQMRQRKIKGAERVHNKRVAAEKEKMADQKKVHSMLRKTRELRKMRGEEVEQVDEAANISRFLRSNEGWYSLRINTPKKKVTIFVDHEAPDRDSDSLVYIEVNGKEKLGKEVSSSELKKILKKYLDAGKREGARISVPESGYPGDPWNEEVEHVDEGRRRGMIDDEGYRRDSRGREYNPVDDRIRARNAARHRAEAEAKRKKAEAERKKKEKTNESVGITEDDKAEYNKLMDKYGDMPMSKVPMKARLRIRELGRSVRGDKGGPTAGDLVKSMKRRRMGEDVEQTDEGVLDGGRVGGVRDKIDTAIRKNRINKQRELRDKSFKYTQSDSRAQRLTRKMKSAQSTQDSADQRMRNRKIEQGKAEKEREYARKKAKQRNEEVEVAEARKSKRRLPGYKVTPKKKEKSSKKEWDRLSGEEPNLLTKSGKPQIRRSLRDRDWVEESMIGRTKPSRELNVQKDEKPHLAGVKSLKYQKRAAHKAERKKGKQDIKKGD